MVTIDYQKGGAQTFTIRLYKGCCMGTSNNIFAQYENEVNNENVEMDVMCCSTGCASRRYLADSVPRNVCRQQLFAAFTL